MPTSKPRDYWFSLIAPAARSALEGQTPDSLLAYSFDLWEEPHTVLLKAHFEGLPSMDDIETMNSVEAEISADFPDDFLTRTELQIVMPWQKPVLLPGGVAYSRAATAEDGSMS